MRKRTIMAVLMAAGILNACYHPGNFGTAVPWVAYAAEKGVVTGSNLRVRTGAGTDKEQLTYKDTAVMLSKGTEVIVKKAIEADDITWYQVSFTYKGKSMKGYVSSDYVKTTGVIVDSGSKDDSNSAKDENNSNKDDNKNNNKDDNKDTSSDKKPVSSGDINAPAKIAADKLNVRKTASTKGKRVTSVSRGASVKVLKEKLVDGKKWYYISFTENKKTQKGYVLSDYVRLSLSKNLAGTMQSSSSVNLRKAAGTDKPYVKAGSKTVSLKNKTDVIVTRETVDSKGAKWLEISGYYKNKLYSGYVNAEKVKLSKVITVTGKVVETNALNVRVAAGTSKKQLTYKGENVKLSGNTSISILGQTSVNETIWYQGTFSYKGKTLKGYVSSDYIEITKTSGVPKSLLEAVTGKPDKEENENTGDNNNAGDNNNDSNTGNNGNNGNNGENNNNGTTDVPLSSAEFEAYMTEQGFPETYKNGLRSLHEKHPTWVFKAYQTGLDWNTALSCESKVGLNLISKNKANGWKSYEEKAYNWATDTFIPYDGSTWVTASVEANAYYMDPRNFLTERAVFQFASLEYQMEHETLEGIEKILANTPLYQKTFIYEDSMTGETREITYSQAFMDAAAASGVSPYHLATRVKQEVVSGSTTLSNSANGNCPGYEGYYNFYNIGANHSTAAGGAVANGLSFAKGDHRTNESARMEYLIPWDNPYKAIVGGAKYIGKQYINRGQNTIYLQKFNVTGNATYTHQYMANVEAGNAEATKLYNGYVSMLDTMPLVFNIPVYMNMPEALSPTPGIVPSPNNWLKTLRLGGGGLEPAFDAKDGGKTAYTLDLTSLAASSISLTAVPVSDKAAVEVRLNVNGNEAVLAQGTTAMIPVNAGVSTLSIIVTAESGTTNTYTITLIK